MACAYFETGATILYRGVDESGEIVDAVTPAATAPWAAFERRLIRTTNVVGLSARVRARLPGRQKSTRTDKSKRGKVWIVTFVTSQPGSRASFWWKDRHHQTVLVRRRKIEQQEKTEIQLS